MRRIEAEHEPIEEPASPARTFEKEPIHQRRQPQRRRVARRAPLGCAPARRRCCTTRRSLARSYRDRSRPEACRAASRRPRQWPTPDPEPRVREPGRRSISVSLAPRNPRPGARNDSASNRLVLPAPFGPVSTTGSVPRVSLRLAIIAKIGQVRGASHRRACTAAPALLRSFLCLGQHR